MPKNYYPDTFKIKVVKHYKMHRNISATFEKYGIGRSTLFKWKKKYDENHFLCPYPNQTLIMFKNAKKYTSRIPFYANAQPSFETLN